MSKMTTEQKALHFLVALKDVYRNEEDRKLDACVKLELTDDATDDFTAMLLAMHVLLKQMSGYDGDLIDFTHVLNKLAVQHLMKDEGAPVEE